jgi:hypothetical protein
MNDGGAAFPWTDTENDGGLRTETRHPGMSLRDWFAGQALAAIVGPASFDPEAAMSIKTMADNKGLGNAETIALLCYGFAEAMVRHREKLEKTP